MKTVGELEQMVSKDVPLRCHVHARITGACGKAIHKIMDEFKADICFLHSRSLDPNCVTNKAPRERGRSRYPHPKPEGGIADRHGGQ